MDLFQNRFLRSILDTSPLDIARLLTRRVAKNECALLRLSAEQLVELTAMRQDNAHAGWPFKASRHWMEVVKTFEDEFRRVGIQNPENQLFNLFFSGFALNDLRLHRYVCWMYRRLLEPRDKFNLLQKLSATCKRGHGFGYDMGGEFLSLDLLFSIDDFYNLHEVNSSIATEPVVVAELGAGWGRLGYVLLKANPRATYVIFDLPEVLLISQTHLPTLVPSVSYVPYTKARATRHNRQSLSASRLWFLGPHQLNDLEHGSVDCVVNIASFQEMPEDYVKRYFQLFGFVAQGGCCYLRQLRDGKAHGHHFDEIPGLDRYPFPKEWHKKYLRSSILSDEFFEAAFILP